MPMVFVDKCSVKPTKWGERWGMTRTYATDEGYVVQVQWLDLKYGRWVNVAEGAQPPLECLTTAMPEWDWE